MTELNDQLQSASSYHSIVAETIVQRIEQVKQELQSFSQTLLKTLHPRDALKIFNDSIKFNKHNSTAYMKSIEQIIQSKEYQQSPTKQMKPFKLSQQSKKPSLTLKQKGEDEGVNITKKIQPQQQIKKLQESFFSKDNIHKLQLVQLEYIANLNRTAKTAQIRTDKAYFSQHLILPNHPNVSKQPLLNQDYLNKKNDRQLLQVRREANQNQSQPSKGQDKTKTETYENKPLLKEENKEYQRANQHKISNSFELKRKQIDAHRQSIESLHRQQIKANGSTQQKSLKIMDQKYRIQIDKQQVVDWKREQKDQDAIIFNTISQLPLLLKIPQSELPKHFIGQLCQDIRQPVLKIKDTYQLEWQLSRIKEQFLTLKQEYEKITLFNSEKQKIKQIQQIMSNQKAYITQQKLNFMQKHINQLKRIVEDRLFKHEYTCKQHMSQIKYVSAKQLIPEKVYQCEQCMKDSHIGHQIICKKHSEQITFLTHALKAQSNVRQDTLLNDEANDEQRYICRASEQHRNQYYGLTKLSKLVQWNKLKNKQIDIIEIQEDFEKFISQNVKFDSSTLNNMLKNVNPFDSEDKQAEIFQPLLIFIAPLCAIVQERIQNLIKVSIKYQNSKNLHISAKTVFSIASLNPKLAQLKIQGIKIDALTKYIGQYMFNSKKNEQNLGLIFNQHNVKQLSIHLEGQIKIIHQSIRFSIEIYKAIDKFLRYFKQVSGLSLKIDILSLYQLRESSINIISSIQNVNLQFESSDSILFYFDTNPIFKFFHSLKQLSKNRIASFSFKNVNFDEKSSPLLPKLKKLLDDIISIHQNTLKFVKIGNNTFTTESCSNFPDISDEKIKEKYFADEKTFFYEKKENKIVKKQESIQQKKIKQGYQLFLKIKRESFSIQQLKFDQLKLKWRQDDYKYVFMHLTDVEYIELINFQFEGSILLHIPSKRIQNLFFSKCKQINNQDIIKYSQKWPELTQLSISHCYNVTYEILKSSKLSSLVRICLHPNYQEIVQKDPTIDLKRVKFYQASSKLI